MQPQMRELSNPREYTQHIVVFNPYRKDRIRLVFPGSAKINDTSLVAGRRLRRRKETGPFYGMPDVRSKPALLRAIQKAARIARQNIMSREQHSGQESIRIAPVRFNLRRVRQSLKDDAILFRLFLQNAQLLGGCVRGIELGLHTNGFKSNWHFFRDPQGSLQVHFAATVTSIFRVGTPMAAATSWQVSCA